MMPAKQRLLAWGLQVSLAYGVATHLMFIFRDEDANYLSCTGIVTFHLVICLPGLLPRREAQVDWYRRSLFVPWTVPWGVGLMAGVGLDGVACLLLVPALLGFAAAPLVWLVGALVLRHRRRLEAICE